MSVCGCGIPQWPLILVEPNQITWQSVMPTVSTIRRALHKAIHKTWIGKTYIKLRAGSNCYLFFPGCPVVDINLSNLSFGWHDIREFLASSFSALIYAQMGSRLSDFNPMLFPWDGIREWGRNVKCTELSFEQNTTPYSVSVQEIHPEMIKSSVSSCLSSETNLFNSKHYNFIYVVKKTT